MSPTKKHLHYEWDEDKDIINQLKHQGLGFADAISAFNDPQFMSMYDPDHSVDEDRFIALGRDSTGQILLVSFTLRGDDEHIRLISARKATKHEEKQYYSG